MKLKPEAQNPQPTPADRRFKRDVYDEGLAVLAFLRDNRPEDEKAIAFLREQCPWKHAIDVETGTRIEPATNQVIAAWTGKNPRIMKRMRDAGLIPPIAAGELAP